MHAALRPYITAGIALVGASVIAVAPVTPSLPGLPVEQPATRLLASSILNIPANLLIAAINIPYYESLALQEYAYALGPPPEEVPQPEGGGVPGWIPPGATEENGGVEVVDGQEYYARGGTGSWWRQSPTGNTWGWDDGNWPQMAAIAHAIAPFEVSLSIVQQLQTFAQAEYIAGAARNCEFNCADVLGYLGGWLVFQTPLTSLLSGTTFPVTINAYPDTYPVWSCGPGEDCTDPTVGQPARLDPLLPLQLLAVDLMEDPSLEEIKLPDLGDVLSNGVKLGVDYINDYNPLVTGSFLYWGAPTLWSVPAALAGLVQNFTGIPNQFIETPQWYGLGGPYPGAENAGPASLLTGVPQGVEHLVRGLLGYLDPSTYLRISLGNTLLRTYASGSLPGSGIVESLTGLPSPQQLLDNLPDVGGLLGSSDSANLTRASNVDPSDEKPVTLNVAPDQGDPTGDTVIDPGAEAEAHDSVVPLQGQVQEGTHKALSNVENAGPRLNVQKLNPLDSGNAQDDGDTVTVDTDTDTTGNHGPGVGKTPVRDLINKVRGAGEGKDAAASEESDE